MDSTPSPPKPPTQHPPNPNLQGIHNAAIIFITLTVKRKICSLQSPQLNTWQHIKMSWHAADIRILHLCALPSPVCLSTDGQGLGDVRGSCRNNMVHFTLFANASVSSPFLLLNMRAMYFLFTAWYQTRSKNTLCWQLAAINSTVILCGRFSSNASLLTKWENWTPSRWPESRQTQKNTNKIYLCQLHLQPEWRCTVEQCLNRERESKAKKHRKKERNRKKQKESIQADHHSSLSLG